mmetsp:Transcript_73148/g.160018  ORF Transcript_73148/g.160018 Transcript_73148/m.160018 type:complete len:542 (+) Transcript_73148:86-1711(+)
MAEPESSYTSAPDDAASGAAPETSGTSGTSGTPGTSGTSGTSGRSGPGRLAGMAAGRLSAGGGFIAGGLSRISGQAGGLLAGAHGQASGVVTGLRERAGQGLEVGASQYTHLAGKMNNFWQERAKVDLPALQGAGFGLPAVGPRWQRAKLEGQRKLLDLGAPIRAKVMFGLLCATKSAVTADPDMCECVRVRLADLTDVFWNDLTIYVEQLFEDQKSVMMGKAAADLDELGGMGPRHTAFSLGWWRAFVLYHMMPFDRSIFGQVKDPIFWVFTIVSLVPSYGIRVMFFALILFLIILGRPADEYQLTLYIIGFKGSQFISSGILQATIAAVRYYMCVHPGGTHTCDVDGPGQSQDLVTGMIDFLGSCILTWVAFWWLPFSDRSAGMRSAVEQEVPGPQDEEAEPETAPTSRYCCCKYSAEDFDTSRGGRLRGLLGWDITSFLLGVLFMVGLMYSDVAHLRPGGSPATTPTLNDMLTDTMTWQGHTAIFWARVFYAFLSFPFVIFLIPGLSSVLTHTTPTGYNRHGYCVPFVMRPMPDEKTD